MIATIQNLIAQAADTATTAAGQAPGGTGQKPPAPDSGLWMMGLMFAAIVFIMVMSSGKRKKEENARNNMLSNLKKNDRIMTIGGIVGTVVNVSEKEVSVKVDETTNTKMTFTKDAIRQVVDTNTPK